MTRARLSFAEQLPVTEVKAIFVFTAAQGEAGGRRALPGWTGHLKNQPSNSCSSPPASHTWVQTTTTGLLMVPFEPEEGRGVGHLTELSQFICLLTMYAMHTPHFCTSLCLKKSNKLEVYTIRLSFNECCMVSSLKVRGHLECKSCLLIFLLMTNRFKTN